MTIGTYAMAFGLALGVVGASTVPTLAQTDEAAVQHTDRAGVQMNKNMHHRSTRGHTAYARAPAAEQTQAKECWINSDKGAIDHGVYGYYGSCNSPGAVPAETSVWGRNRYSNSYGSSEY